MPGTGSEARQRSMARARPALRPGGRTGSRQPNGSSRAGAPPIASTGPDSQRQLQGPGTEEAGLPGSRLHVGRRPVRGELARAHEVAPPLRGLLPEELGRGGHLARLVDDEECVGAEVVEAARRADDSRPDLGRVAHVEGPGAGPRAPAAEAAAAVAPPDSAVPSSRARSAARRSGSRAASRPSRARISSIPAAGTRNSLAGRSSMASTGRTVRWSVGSKSRISSISSPKSSIRAGRSAPAGKTSTRPPRRAISPRPATSRTGS